MALMEPRLPTPSLKEIEDLITKDMSQLSMKGREDALHDVHGIVEAGYESPEQIAQGLYDLDAELMQLKEGTAYEKAVSMSKEYVINRLFQLTFLRADNFNAISAARRMVRYFEEKRTLFGEEKLTKDIVLEDLDENDMDTLRSGYMQVLPMKDQGGRRIIAIMTKLRRFKNVENTVS
jgi:hypothetical protein